MGCGASSIEGEDNNIQNVDQEEVDDMAIYDQMENKKKDDNDGALFGEAELEDGEQFMATKPWIGALKEPSNPPEVDLENPPAQQLELEYVNGYRCEDSRQNLYYTNQDGQIVFMSAAVGVVQNVAENTQSFFGAGKVGEVVGHNDDIESLHVNPDRSVCVTGQRGKNPSIFVWDIQSKEVIASYKQGRNTRAVRQVRFTPEGDHFFTCDISNDHNIHIYKTDGSGKVAQTKTGNDTVYDMAICSKGSYAGAIATKRGVQFIEWSGGAGLEMKRGLGCRDFMVSVAYKPDSDVLYAGSTKGEIFIFHGNSSNKHVKIHKGGIHAIVFSGNNMITSGYQDHQLKVSDSDSFQEIKVWQMDADYARSLDAKDETNVLVGTRDGQIMEYNVNEDQPKLIMNGHGTGEAWGLDITPEGNIITTGDDNKILCFNPNENKVTSTGIVNTKAGKKKKILGASTLSRFPPNQCARAVAVHPSNGHIAVATNDGELSIRSSQDNLNGFELNTKRLASGWIEVMQYSPDGNWLAVGSHSRAISFLDVNGGYQVKAYARAHKAALLNIDWTCDSTAVRAVCNAYELLFHDIQGNQLKSGATQFKDEEFASQTCKLGWWVQGIFPPATDGSHINGICRNNNKDICATGDDWGFVNLYKLPNVKGSKCHSYRAHSSHVVRVKFNADDTYLYSIGGYDRCLMKWRVV